MKIYDGLLPTDVMHRFPSGTAAASFGDWVANHVGLEQVLGLAGFLAPEFVEVRGHVFWDRRMGEALGMDDLNTPVGNDAVTVERYWNTLNLAEFFLLSADEAVHREDLVAAFGCVLQHFWSIALRSRFPDRCYRFEIAPDLFHEEGLCLTFWRDRS